MQCRSPKSDALDDHSAVVGTFEAVFARLAIERTVVPGLGFFESGKFKDNYSLDIRAFSTTWRP